jgi:parallel beta-helix repeat protein
MRHLATTYVAKYRTSAWPWAFRDGPLILGSSVADPAWPRRLDWLARGGNTFAENAKDGIFIDRKSTGNSLSNNVAINNGRLGINVQGTATVGSPNRAFGNGWSAQCRGIPCVGK